MIVRAENLQDNAGRPIGAGQPVTEAWMAGNGFDYDVIVIGSGSGGSVAALRAREEGYRVAVLKSDRRWPDDQVPKTSCDIRKFAWQPEAEMYGIQGAPDELRAIDLDWRKLPCPLPPMYGFLAFCAARRFARPGRLDNFGAKRDRSEIEKGN
jgi:choline dehydrogenase-like flavoprotein